jgi:predicted glycoside hydrolase/deacetylase ChbG (UPF0249 family)
MDAQRFVVVTADDFGMGPETSLGILDLARAGAVTGTVLLVNSPYAEAAVQAWRRAGQPLELGWHPCLTLDRPLLPADHVPSLVDGQGRFPSLGTFLLRLMLGCIRASEMEAELRAQLEHFRALVGRAPTLVNGHHHIHALPRVGQVLRRILAELRPLPYLRRMPEPRSSWFRISGGRVKRAWLNLTGRPSSRKQARLGFPGNDWLVGLGRPIRPDDPTFFTRWLALWPGQVIELACHPGYRDETLLGRDASTVEELDRRERELHRLLDPTFRQACQRFGRRLVAPGQLAGFLSREEHHDAA